MKIFYFISVKGHGRGGHFHSLNHIASAMGNKNEVMIYTVGPGRSHILEKNQYFRRHFYFNTINFLHFKKALSNEINSGQPDVIHCFDLEMFRIIKLAYNGNIQNIVLNKCGGPNPIRFPLVDKLAVFSIENYDWFTSRSRFSKMHMTLIPNRVNKSSIQINVFDEYKKREDFFTFVRIGRIGETYKKSFLDAINLISVLKNRGIRSCLYIIGVVESAETLKDLRGYASGLEVEFITESRFTEKASKMLYLADAVIATGRGVMEATALGLPILTTMEGAEIPVLVSEQNFQVFFSRNFSQRSFWKQYDRDLNLDAICHLITNDSHYERFSNFSRDIFSLHFDVEQGVFKYIELYQKPLAIMSLYSIKNDFRDLLKTLYVFYKKSKIVNNE